MKIKILVITHNRPHYTRLCLTRLTETVPDNAGITIWDNASTRETVEAVRSFESHKAVERVVYNKTNDKLRGPTNWFWRNSADAELLSKVDDDCLMPALWCEKLTAAHKGIPNAGILGCWRFQPEDFTPEKALKKIVSYGPHTLLRNCWVEGSGYLLKRRIIDEIGCLRPNETFTTWCIRAETKGYINGWYYPFLYQEHMDDPRAGHTSIKTDEDLMKLLPLSAAQYGVKTKEEWVSRLRDTAKRLQEYSLDPYDFIGMRSKIIRRLHSLAGLRYFPKV